jgi:hypothetical protein
VLDKLTARATQQIESVERTSAHLYRKVGETTALLSVPAVAPAGGEDFFHFIYFACNFS